MGKITVTAAKGQKMKMKSVTEKGQTTADKNMPKAVY